MKKDKALEELFLAARPTFDDGDAFIARLEKRLDAVEYLKQHEEACIRRYRYAMLAAFVLGIVLGGGAIALMLAMPAEDTHPLGRLFDIDIINADGVPVSRDAIGEKPRRCLVCDHEARYCMRMRWHTQEEIWAKINQMVDSYVEAHKS